MSKAPHHPHAPVHKFGHRRASTPTPQTRQSPLFKGSPFQPLPAPTGQAPFRLDLADIIPDAVAAMTKAGGMSLHMVGDTGGVKDPHPQIAVADGMEYDVTVAGPFGTPAFFYHLGDVVYFDGQASEYFPQFYDAYSNYPLPMMGIPGNHDGDVYDDGTRTNPLPSLTTFVRNFCAAQPGTKSPDSGEADRTAMTQPNVYWTLITPFATFIGLYTNVPEGGVVEPDQADWFEAELAAAATDRALIVALHHPLNSLDTYHSGSQPMTDLVNNAVAKSGRKPDMLCSGHVHNYQRFTVADADGKGVTPHIVAGQGGYHNLHKMAKVNGQPIVTPYQAPNDDGVILEAYYDNTFGFLRLDISPETIDLSAYTTPKVAETTPVKPTLVDQLSYNWRTRTIAAPSIRHPTRK